MQHMQLPITQAQQARDEGCKTRAHTGQNRQTRSHTPMHQVPVMAKIFSALFGKRNATASVGARIATVSALWRAREKDAPSPATSMSSVYLAASCADV